MKYLEYDLSTGRILSEILSETEPPLSEGIGIAPIDDESEIDTTNYAVKSGKLVKLSEAAGEREERERILRENQSRMRLRMNEILRESVIAKILEEDESEVANLRREWRRIKSVL